MPTPHNSGIRQYIPHRNPLISDTILVNWSITGHILLRIEGYGVVTAPALLRRVRLPGRKRRFCYSKASKSLLRISKQTIFLERGEKTVQNEREFFNILIYFIKRKTVAGWRPCGGSAVILKTAGRWPASVSLYTGSFRKDPIIVCCCFISKICWKYRLFLQFSLMGPMIGGIHWLFLGNFKKAAP